jgi:DNA invertase Pin-like site-specific DNA recombinase
MRAILYARVSTEAQATDDKTSLSEQLLAMRKYAEANGYEIADEIPEEMSGRKQDTEGLERIRDLADRGKIGAVLVYKWNRLARTVARFESFMLEMKLAGVDVVSLDGQSNATASGRMFNRLMAVFSEYQRDDLVETMQQGKRGVARTGKVVPSRFAPYGFRYDRDSRSYVVDDSRMESVRRLFRMVGVEEKALWAVKRVFDAEAVPTTRGGRYWHVTTLRDMILNDAYRPHTNEELAALADAGNLSPEVLATLGAENSYGIAWYNRHKVETIPGERQIKTPRPRSEWIAMPVPDSGVQREWVDAAREAIKDNVRPSDAGRRHWTLKGFSYCACGARLTPHTVTKKGGPRFYYICHRHRSGRDPCPHARYHRADGEAGLEERVADFVLSLIHNPEVLRERVREQAAREKEALRDTRKQIATLAQRVHEADSERDRYNRLYARGKLTDAEYDGYTNELDEKRSATEEELARLADARRHVEYLEELPQLVEEYLHALPDLVEGTGAPIREYETVPPEREEGPDGSLPIYTLTPERIRYRTPEEIEALREKRERERAERYGAAYAMLALKVVAHHDGSLEIAWRGGGCKLSGLRR